MQIRCMKTTPIACFLAVIALSHLGRAETSPPTDETTAAPAPSPDPYAVRPSVMIGLGQ